MSGRAVVVGSYATGLTIRTDVFPKAGETRLGSDFEQGPGGKGSNQAIGLARHGVDVAFVASLGDDRFGHDAVTLLAAEGIRTDFVRLVPGAATGVGFIVLDASGDNLIVLDPGANELLDAAQVRASLADLVSGGDLVLTQLEISSDAAEAALVAGRASGAITLLNPAPARVVSDAFLRCVDVLTPNESELRILSGLAPDAIADEATLARGLVARGVEAVVVTRGAAGALVVTAARAELVRAPLVDVVDSTGAGDAFSAALGAALLSGHDLMTAAERAVTAGALACTKAGVVPALPTRAEVDHAVPPVVRTMPQ